MLVVHVWHHVTDSGHALVDRELSRVIFGHCRNLREGCARLPARKNLLRWIGLPLRASSISRHFYLQIHLHLHGFFDFIRVILGHIFWFWIDKMTCLLKFILMHSHGMHGKIKVERVGLGLEGILNDEGVRVEQVINFLGLGACNCEGKHTNKRINLSHIILCKNLIL